jgi:Tol biopolymer transport system component
VYASAGESSSSAPSAPAGLSAGRVAAILLGTAIVSVAAGLWLAPESAPQPRPVGRFRMPLPEGLSFSSTGRTAVNISRDGSRLAFSAGDQIWARELGSLEAYPVRGTTGGDGGRNPVYSPDGAQIAFWADDQLRRVPAAGGAALLLTPANNPWGLRWEPDGYLYYGQGSEGIWRVGEQGGRAEQLVELEPGQMAHGGQPLADGSLLFTLRESSADWNDARVVVRSPAGEIRELVNPGRDGRLLPSGHLVFMQDDRLVALPLEEGSLRPLGAPVVAIEGVRGSINLTATGQFGVSDTGTLAYLPGNSGEDYERQVGWMDTDGTITPLGESVNSMLDARVSRDGRYAVGTDSEGSIWVYDLVRDTAQPLVRVANRSGSLGRPLFTPDGRFVLYVSGEQVMRIPADRSGPEEVVFGIEGRTLAPDSFTAEGVLLGRVLESGATGTEVFRVAPEPGAEIEIVAAFPGYIERVRVSPDGRHIAYSSDESGENEVFVRTLETGATLPISAGGGVRPRWSADGSELYFRLPTPADFSSVLVVEMREVDTLTAGRPREAVARVPFVSWDYDFAPDTGQFLLVGWMLDDDATQTQEIRVVTEWFDDLSRRAPVSR